MAGTEMKSASRMLPRIALLMFEAHGLGRIMLREFKAAGIVPELILEESSKLGKKRAGFYEAQHAVSVPNLGTVTDYVATARAEGETVTHIVVANINNDEAVAALKEANVDLIILGGTRVVKDRILECAKYGGINTHPGILPWVQGSLPVAQSIYRGFPIATACHRVSAVLDKGALCSIAFLDRSKCGKRFEDLIFETNRQCTHQVIKVIEHLGDFGTISTFEKLSKAEGDCYTWEDDIEEKARATLEDPNYVVPEWETWKDGPMRAALDSRKAATATPVEAGMPMRAALN